MNPDDAKRLDSIKTQWTPGRLPSGWEEDVQFLVERLDAILAAYREAEAQRDEAAIQLRQARQRLAYAGVEGSPPPGIETTIGALLRVKGELANDLTALRASHARLVEAAWLKRNTIIL